MIGTLQDTGLKIEWVPIGALAPHPENYRTHPQDQLKHLAQSLKEHGFYRPIVTARDLTILAGHGVWQSAKIAKLDTVPVHRRDYEFDAPEALKILVGDNMLPQLAGDNDETLADLLGRIRDESGTGLVGTGFTDDALQALVATITGERPSALDDSFYTTKIRSPLYEVTGERPAPSSLVTTTMTDHLLEQIAYVQQHPEAQARTTHQPASADRQEPSGSGATQQEHPGEQTEDYRFHHHWVHAQAGVSDDRH